MDALARLAPVARPLLLEVDAVLATLGAPAAHPIWRLLGHVGTTPAEVVGFVADLEPGRLAAAAAALRAQQRSYGEAPTPPATAWEGQAARQYATTSAAVREHLAGDGPHSLAGRLQAVASFVEGMAEWQQGLRDDLARQLARVLASREAATVRSYHTRPEPGALMSAAAAAADVGAALLRVAQDAAAAGLDMVRAAPAAMAAPYHPPTISEPGGGPVGMR
jgi:hypothetical protein